MARRSRTDDAEAQLASNANQSSLSSHCGHLQRQLKTAGMGMDTALDLLDLIRIKIQFDLLHCSPKESGGFLSCESLHCAMKSTNGVLGVLDGEVKRDPYLNLVSRYHMLAIGDRSF